MKLQAISMFAMHLLILSDYRIDPPGQDLLGAKRKPYYVDTNMKKDFLHTLRETAKSASHGNERQPTTKNKISGAEHRSKSKTNENLKIERKGVQKGRTWYKHSRQPACTSAKLDASSAYGGRRKVGTQDKMECPRRK